jgi:hypothetical protein
MGETAEVQDQVEFADVDHVAEHGAEQCDIVVVGFCREAALQIHDRQRTEKPTRYIHIPVNEPRAGSARRGAVIGLTVEYNRSSLNDDL